MDSIFRETEIEIKRDKDGLSILFMLVFYCGSSFFVSNPYYVVLNRQSSGKRSAL